MKHWIFFTILFSFTLAPASPYNFDFATNTCNPKIDSDNSLYPKKSAEKIKLHRYVTDEFLSRNPICQNKTSCLNSEYVDNLFRNNKMPMAIHSYNLAGSKRHEYVRTTCPRNRVNEIESMKDFDTNLAKKIFPQSEDEVNHFFHFLKETKERAETEMKLGIKAIDSLQECFLLDAIYEKEGFAFPTRKSRYEYQQKQDKNIQKGCSEIWAEKGEYAHFQKKLSELRLVLHGLALKESRSTKSLHHKKGSILGVRLNSFWDETPDTILPLNKLEMEEFEKRSDLNSTTKDHLLIKYYQLISESPLLIYFDKPKLDSIQISRAFQKHSTKFKKSLSIKDDFDYLGMPILFQSSLESYPEEIHGDLCLLTARLEQDRDFLKGFPELVFTTLAFASGVSAVSALAKPGLTSKAIAFLAGGSGFGTLASATLVTKNSIVMQEQFEQCTKISHGSEGICDVNSFEKNHSDLLVSAAATLVFRSTPKIQNIILKLKK